MKTKLYTVYKIHKKERVYIGSYVRLETATRAQALKLGGDSYKHYLEVSNENHC